MNEVLYKESQHMVGSGVMIAVYVVLLLLAAFMYRGMNRLNRIVAIIVMGIMTCVLILFSNLKLETVYYPGHADHGFSSVFGVTYDRVSLDSVIAAEVVTYNPNEYGGWGDKEANNTKVYTASGNKGLVLLFKSGRKVLLGTQQPDSLNVRLKGYYPFDNQASGH